MRDTLSSIVHNKYVMVVVGFSGLGYADLEGTYVKSATHLGCLAHGRRLFTDALKAPEE